MSLKKKRPSPVAVIGIGCIFAKSPDLKAFYHLLSRGISGISDPPGTHQHLNDYYDPDPKKPDHIYCKRGGFLPSVAFDPTEFSIPPNVIEATDTSQLLSLITAKKALEDAGYGEQGKAFDRNKASVILGVTGTQELVIPLGARLGHPIWRRALKKAGVPDDQANDVIHEIGRDYVSWQENSFPGLLGNVVAGRIANRLDLGGTNCVVDAACASSMGAIHMALLELRSGRSDMVISGGVDTINDAFMHMCFSKTQILSSSGDIRPFSKDADGTVLGEGIGLVVLKRLEDAERDGDRIYAVIKGLGSSSDGKSQSIYAPRTEGQAKALRRAYEEAGIDPTTVSLIEAHGTGTQVGDAVEFKTLCDVFGEVSPNGNRCALGSVKSNIGHTKAAAGTAGIIKAALAIYHKVLPPTLKAEPADPNLGVEHSPFYLNTQLRPWLTQDDEKRRAGVNAFGFGGSNFHAVLEEHTHQKTEPSWDGSVEIAAFSDVDAQAVKRKMELWMKKALDQPTPWAIGQLARQSRKQFQHDAPVRLVMVIDAGDDSGRLARTCEDAMGMLFEKEPSSRHSVFIGRGKPAGGLAFLFPGQGSQYVGMGRDLTCCFPEGLSAFHAASSRLGPDVRLDEFVFPRILSDARQLEAQLRQTQIAQPAIGAVSVTMLNILKGFGVIPDATCGHSYGELVALHAAGWMDQTDLWKLSIERGALMARAGAEAPEQGTMLAVQAPLHDIERLVDSLDSQVVLANRNSLEQGVLSGTSAGIDAAEKACHQEGWRCVRLPVAAAFHSPLIGGAQQPFSQSVTSIEFHPGPTVVMSNALGRAYPESIDAIRETLGRQLACPVDFVANVQSLYEKGMRTFVEVGPRTVLTQLVRATLKDKAIDAIAMDRSKGRHSGIKDLAAVLSQLAAIGYPVRLALWEKPHSANRKAKMAIPLSGANYRAPQSGHHDVKAASRQVVTEPAQGADHDPRRSEVNTPAPPINTDLQGKDTAKYPNAASNATPSLSKTPDIDGRQRKSIRNALATVQQGLDAIQALHSKTAHAHEKFLETQAQAGRTLQQLLQSVRQMSPESFGDTGFFVDPPRIDAGAEAAEMAPKSAEIQHSAEMESKTTQRKSAAADIAPDHSEIPSKASPDDGRETLRLTLLEIVAHLTGYPSEMLGMEMDIESDLGIDSIKRVEILSALEERLPDLPKVTPDMMGTLKTLGQICEYLSGNTILEPTPVGPAKEIPPDSGSRDGGAVARTLVEIVSELTGYPSEMLGMEMDIESDLGIDSIKRVEILSALEERLPDLPKVTPDMMGTLKTLGQICEYLSGNTVLEPAPVGPAKEIPPDSGSRDGGAVARTLVEIVTHLTGYPSEMLGMEMDIESDLGIDSIKRVEILSALEERLPDLPKVTPDMMGTLKTLGQITQYLSKPAARKVSTTSGLSVKPDIHVVKTPENSRVERKMIKLVHLEKPKSPSLSIPDGGVIGVAGDRDGLAGELAASLIRKGVGARQLRHPKDISADLQLVGLVLIAPMEANEAFKWAQTFASVPKSSNARFVTVSALDGAFGFNDRQISDPFQGGLAGLAKTAAIEWTDVRCLAMDIDPRWNDIPAVADALGAEILNAESRARIEIGIGPEGAVGLDLEDVSPEPNRGVDLEPQDVVIVTGGARGVTAVAVRALASHTPCTLALIGRSPAPQPEPRWLEGLTDEGEIKRSIFDHWPEGNAPAPKKIEKKYRQWMANRQVLATLNDLKRTGASCHYFSADIRDAQAVASLLERIRGTIGRIRGVIHGAGVLEDRLIVDKLAEQFDNVYDTKVEGVKSLLKATIDDDLKYMVFFSSVSARQGNQGQADYAMANEVLNKVARQQQATRPGCKVVSINWGPWDGGMVTPGLKRNFLKHDIALIPLDIGAQAMVDEMAQPLEDPVEVVIGGALTGRVYQPSPAPKAAEWTITCKRDVSLERYPVLESHQLDGRPVVPLALITEWLAHSALHAHPGLVLHGMDNLRLLNGITLDQQSRLIHMLAGKAVRNGQMFEVDVEIRDDQSEGPGRAHSSAKAILSERLPAPPVFQANGHFTPAPAVDSPEDLYEHVLFHGRDLRGIKEIVRISHEGMSAKLASAPPPARWINEPLRSRWIADPLILDSAFQMAIVWCHKHHGLVCLPSYAASYRQYCRRFPEDGVSAVLEVHRCNSRKMTGDFTFLDSGKKVVAQLKGYEAIMDPSLINAFKAA